MYLNQCRIFFEIVGGMLKTGTGYGMVLGGLSTSLVSALKSEIMARDAIFSDFIAALKPKIPVGSYFLYLFFPLILNF